MLHVTTLDAWSEMLEVIIDGNGWGALPVVFSAIFFLSFFVSNLIGQSAAVTLVPGIGLSLTLV